MRSYREILFRIRQELSNARMLMLPPRAPAVVRSPRPVLPEPGPAVRQLKGTSHAATVEQIADKILHHRFPILGITVETGPAIAWRRDYVSGIETGLAYFRRIPFLDPTRVGDFKVVCEINRHQHMILLAQAFLLTGRRDFLDETHRQLEGWLEANPFGRGINWTSALEVAFRALSWMWIFHWTGAEFPEPLRTQFLESLYRHGCHLECNLSIYFSPNTHLLGEAVALHLLGRVFPEWPRSAAWERKGHQIVVEQMQAQVRDDGGYFEQSSHYHVYALDFFLLHKLFAQSVPAAYDARLRRMAELLDALMGCRWSIPLIGDDDGGRLFHPYGNRDEFSRGTLAAAAAVCGRPEWVRRPEDMYDIAAWWVGDAAFAVAPQPEFARASALFHHTGLAVLRAGEISLIVDAGPFGPGSAAHSHSDTLSIIAYAGTEEILIDAGTYTYVDPHWRNQFRGSAAHNTVRVDAHDQAQPVGPFRWSSKPDVRIRVWESSGGRDYLDAECRYNGVVHRRALVLAHEAQCVFVLDIVTGPAGDRTVEQFWHTGRAVAEAGNGQYRIGSQVKLVFPADAETECSTGGEHGWRSRALGQREPSPVVRVFLRGALPAVMAVVLDFTGGDTDALHVRTEGDTVELRYGAAVVQIAAIIACD